MTEEAASSRRLITVADQIQNVIYNEKLSPHFTSKFGWLLPVPEMARIHICMTDSFYSTNDRMIYHVNIMAAGNTFVYLMDTKRSTFVIKPGLQIPGLVVKVDKTGVFASGSGLIT